MQRIEKLQNSNRGSLVNRSKTVDRGLPMGLKMVGKGRKNVSGECVDMQFRTTVVWLLEPLTVGHFGCVGMKSDSILQQWHKSGARHTWAGQRAF